jgi:hypothetical protein
MASPIAHAPHSGPVDQPGEGAYLWARSGIARSATTRSNYVSISTSIDWIVRDNNGNIISTTDLSGIVLLGSLHVTQALNDEPDTCSFTLKPQDPPAAVPQVGQEIRITWAPGGPPVFHGYIVTRQSDWRLANMQPPWIAIQCQDPMWRFDARMVTYRFPAQSVTASIQFLVEWFCNHYDQQQPTATFPRDFLTGFVQPGMPSIPAFDVVNQRPSTVMRTLTQAVNGGFYIEGFTVHAWANSVSEPDQTNPQPLTVGLKTLHTFRRTDDGSQLRRRVLVEGRRTSTLISLPTCSKNLSTFLGVPVDDATMFNLAAGVDARQLCRIGTQWIYAQNPISVRANGANPPQTKIHGTFTPGQTTLLLKAMPTTPPAKGWVRVGNQYSRYESFTGDPHADGWTIYLPVATFPYGVFTVPIPIGETVEWVDALMYIEPAGLMWDAYSTPQPSPGEDDLIRAQVTSAPVVTLAMADDRVGVFPPLLEGFVQDGRYSYAGAQARAADDLAAFKNPLTSVEWETDDLNALPGRSQVIALSSETVNPAINTTVTILRVEITFPLRTLPPRRSCTGGTVKPSTFMDLVVTESN